MKIRPLLLALVLLLSRLTGCAATYPAARAPAVAAPSVLDYSSSDGALPGGGQPAAETQAPTKRLVIYTASVEMEVGDEDDFEPTLLKIRKMAEEAGGYMQNRSSEYITVKVPADAFTGFLDELEQLGEILEKDVYGTDVTERHRDLVIRLDNAEKVRARYLKLLDAAANVHEALAVEKELERITEKIEKLKGELKSITQGITFATITVRLEEKVTPGPIGWVFYGLGWLLYHLFVWD